MAIIPELQYPDKITTATEEYPYGAARNVTLPGDGTGTPWEQSLVNDIFGFQQALLTKANIIPSGVPDNATDSQYLDALEAVSGIDFSSVAAIDLPGISDDETAILSSWEPGGFNGAGILKWDSSVPKSKHDGVLIFSPTVPYINTLDYLTGVGETDPDGEGCWLLVSGEIIFNATVNVPSDYVTMQDAFDALKKFSITNSATITINIESGHALTKGLLIRGHNAGHFIISSEDQTVSLNPNFIAAKIDPSVTGAGTNNAIIAAEFGATTPIIDILVDANLLENSGIGLFVGDASAGIVTTGSGILNAEFYGFLVTKSSALTASGSVFNGSNWGCSVSQNSLANIALASLNDVRSKTYGESGVTAGLNVSGASLVNFKGEGGTATGCASRGIAAKQGRISAQYVDVSFAGAEGVLSEESSSISFADGIANNCGESAIRSNASTLDASRATANNSALAGIIADDCSQVNAREISIVGYGTYGIRANSGSTINVRQASVLKTETEEAGTDIVVTSGSTINAALSTGGLNQTAQSVTANGIIFKEEEEVEPPKI